MQNVVLASYETTRAFSWLAAIQAKSYTLEQNAQESNSLQITFQGTADKTHQTETVDWIPRDVLEAVIRGIHMSNQEALRPENVALLSPRVLWSLMYCFKQEEEEMVSIIIIIIISLADCYEALLPNLDWTFLRRRAQQLS